MLSSVDWLQQSEENLVAEGRKELVGAAQEFQDAIARKIDSYKEEFLKIGSESRKHNTYAAGKEKVLQLHSNVVDFIYEFIF